jgi:hypothetical protein
MTWHQINEEREDLRVMVMTQVKTDINAHDPPLRAHNPAFDHNTCRFKCYILSMKLCLWPCALRVRGSSCWKTDVANLVTVLVTLLLRLALGLKFTIYSSHFHHIVTPSLTTHVSTRTWRRGSAWPKYQQPSATLVAFIYFKKKTLGACLPGLTVRQH